MESGTFVDPAVMSELETNFVTARLFTYGILDEALSDANRKVLALYMPGDTPAPAYAIVTPEGKALYTFAGPHRSASFLNELEIAKQLK